MNELVKVDPKDYGLEETQAVEITKGLQTILEERSVLIDNYKETIALEITEDSIPVFKALRLQIVKNRTQGLKVWHKANKAYFLAGGNFVQEIYNKEVIENERMESQLMEAEKHFENLENERIEKLSAERYESCLPFVEDISLILPDLGTMPVALWDNYIIGLKASFEAKKAEEKRIEAERLAAEKAEIERQKAIEVENAKLKAEAEEREKQLKIESEKRAKEEVEKQAKLNAERKEQEAKVEKIRIEAENKLKAEREEKERIAEALRIKEENEKKELERIELEKQSELNKGDSAKVKDLIADLETLKTKYSFKSAKNNKMYDRVGLLLDKVIADING